MNEEVYKYYFDVMIIVEELILFFKVFCFVFDGGLGFGFKWNMGWMYDLLYYIFKDFVYRYYYYGDIIFSMVYVFDENFVLLIFYDEVVYGKGSLIGKMFGDEW